MTPGIHLNLPAPEYHAEPAISASQLRKLWQTTPAHFNEWRKTPEEPSIEMILGTLCHQAVLEPHLPLPQIAVIPETYTVNGEEKSWNGNSKYCKAWKAEKVAAGILPIRSHDMDRIRNAAAAIARHAEAKHLINSIESTEVSILCDLPQFGLRGKARLDIVPRINVLGDLKFTHDASTRGFQDHAYRMGYHLQAAWYLDMWNAVADHKEGFRIIAIEDVPPYAVNVFEMSKGLIEHGRECYEKALNTYAECVRSDNWPAYGDDINEIGKPYWVK